MWDELSQEYGSEIKHIFPVFLVGDSMASHQPLTLGMNYERRSIQPPEMNSHQHTQAMQRLNHLSPPEVELHPHIHDLRLIAAVAEA